MIELLGPTIAASAPAGRWPAVLLEIPDLNGGAAVTGSTDTGGASAVTGSTASDGPHTVTGDTAAASWTDLAPPEAVSKLPKRALVRWFVRVSA